MDAAYATLMLLCNPHYSTSHSALCCFRAVPTFHMYDFSLTLDDLITSVYSKPDKDYFITLAVISRC